jgi:hypothetical protein
LPDLEMRANSIAIAVLLLATTAWVPLQAPAAAQDGPDPQPVDQLVWTAAAVQQLLSHRDHPLALAIGTVNRSFERQGVAGVGDAVDLLVRLQQTPGALDHCRATETLEATLCAVEGLRTLAPPALHGDLAEEASRLIALALRPPGTPPGQLGPPTSLLAPLQRYAEGELEHVWTVLTSQAMAPGTTPVPTDARPAAPPAGASLLLERALGDLVGTSPMASARAVLAGAPALSALLDLYPVLESAGDAARISQLSHAFFNAVMDSTRASVRALTAGDVADTPAAGREPVDWAAQRSFVYLASRAASLTGGVEAERLAGGIAAVGQAGADLQRLISGFSGQVGAPGSGTILGALGERAAMLALGGGVFGVAANLTAVLGAVGGGGPQTAREVQALREVVDTLRLELHERFTHVDASLDSMFGVLAINFDRLHATLAEGRAEQHRELAAIHSEIAALGRGLGRLEENLYSYMQAAYDQDYHRTLVRCLEHRLRHAPPFDAMDFATFSGCLAEFRVRAVRDARSAILVDLSTAVDDVSLVAALRDPDPRNLARRLPLLARAAAARFDNPGMQPRGGIANPLEWAVASQAYLSMLYDWPEHARGMTAGDLEEMATVGRELRQAVDGITADAAARPRPGLFDALLRTYEGGALVLRAQVDELMQRHETERLRRVPLDSVVPTMEPEDAALPPLPTPRQLVAALPADLRALAILGIDSVSVTYRLAHEDSVVRDPARRRLFVGLRPFGRVHDRHRHTRTHVTVEVDYAGLGRVATFEATGEYMLRRTEQIAGGHDSDRVRRVVDYVPDPTEHFLRYEWPLFSAGEWRTTHVNAAALRTARDRVENAFRLHSGAVLDDLFATACAGGSEPRAGATPADVARTAAALDAVETGRVLLTAYAAFGLARSLETRPELRAALFGDERIHDRASLCRAVTGGESVLRVLWLDDEPHRRLSVLRSELADIFADGGVLPEPLPILETTLEQLEAAARLQRLRTTATGVEGAR